MKTKSGYLQKQQTKPERKSTGKRSDPNYAQVTAYLPKNTYQAVKVNLLKQGKNRGFSDLVEGLLNAWLKKVKLPD